MCFVIGIFLGGEGLGNKNKLMDYIQCLYYKVYMYSIEFQHVLSEWDIASQKRQAPSYADKPIAVITFSKGFSVTETSGKNIQQLSCLYH